jgi:hypothetical protein
MESFENQFWQYNCRRSFCTGQMLFDHGWISGGAFSVRWKETLWSLQHKCWIRPPCFFLP